MGRRYFLCPHCKSLLKNMIEMWKEYNIYKVDSQKIDYKVIDNDVGKHIWTKCPKCKILFENWCAEEFLVEVEDGKINFIGAYWDDFTKEELKELEKEVLKKLLTGGKDE